MEKLFCVTYQVSTLTRANKPLEFHRCKKQLQFLFIDNNSYDYWEDIVYLCHHDLVFDIVSVLSFFIHFTHVNFHLVATRNCIHMIHQFIFRHQIIIFRPNNFYRVIYYHQDYTKKVTKIKLNKEHYHMCI